MVYGGSSTLEPVSELLISGALARGGPPYKVEIPAYSGFGPGQGCWGDTRLLISVVASCRALATRQSIRRLNAIASRENSA